jgi:hypothetical protein
MRAQSLRWLVIAAIVALGAAFYLTSVKRPGIDDAAIDTKLYPELEAALNDVTAVRIFGAGEQQLVDIEKSADGWRVAERANYPANVGRIRELLLALARAKTIEKKTAVEANLPALGLEDLTAPNASGKRLDLAGTPKPVSLLVGKSPDDHSTFVRRAGEPQSWQIDTRLHVDGDPKQWLQATVLEIPVARVKSVATRITGKAAWSIAKANDKDADFTVSGVPRGRELSSPTAAREVASSLTALELDDVRAAASPPPATAGVMTLSTLDGLVVRIEGFVDGESKHWLRIEPSATADATEAVRGEVARIERLTKGYELEVPAYKYSSLLRPIDELLKQPAAK